MTRNKILNECRLADSEFASDAAQQTSLESRALKRILEICELFIPSDAVRFYGFRSPGSFVCGKGGQNGFNLACFRTFRRDFVQHRENERVQLRTDRVLHALDLRRWSRVKTTNGLDYPLSSSFEGMPLGQEFI